MAKGIDLHHGYQVTVRQRIPLIALVAGVGAVCVAGALLHCSSAAEPPREPEAGAPENVEHAPAQCAVRLDGAEPELDALPEDPPPTSTLSVGIDLPTKRIGAELDKNVPRGLASAKRKPVGAAGEVTYNVTRGAFGFALKKDRLVVTTPIAVSVEICKPLGPLCPTYGRCYPKLSATASVPLLLGEDYDLEKPTVGYGIAEGCTIAGTDQTGRIRGIADARIAAVRGQIQKSMPAIKPHAEAVLEEVTKPRPLEGGGCVQILPARIDQAKPALSEGVLSLRAVARGTIALHTEDCPAVEASKLPPLTTIEGSAPTESAIAAAVTVSWEAIGKAVTASVRHTRIAESTIEAVRVKSGRAGEERKILLGVTLHGDTCGEAWLSAEPAVAAGELRLANVTALGDAPVKGLAALFEEKLHIALPPALSGATAALDGLTKLALPQDVPVEVTVELGAPVFSAVPHKSGVMVVGRRTGRITAGFRR